MSNDRMRDVARKSNRISVLIIVAVCLVLGVVLIAGTRDLNAKNRVYAAQEAELESRIAAESVRAKELDEYAEYVKTDEYMKKVAKENFGLVEDDEYAIKAKE